MSLSAQLISVQRNEIIEDKMNTDTGAREVQKHVEDGKQVLDPENRSSELNAVPNTINNDYEHNCLDKVVRLLNTHPIRQSTEDCVPGHKYSIRGLPRTTCLPHQICAILFIVRRWVWDEDMAGVLVADEMCLGKIFTSVAAAMHCKLVTVKVEMGLPLSILWGNTLEE